MAEVILPILLCAAGAALAGVFTLTSLGRRIPTKAMGWLLMLAPLAAFVLLMRQLPALLRGDTFTQAFNWLPTLGFQFSFYLDGLSALFALLVSGIGVLVVIYAGYYFAGGHDPATDSHHHKPESHDARFFLYILLFMMSMLGLVLAGDVITLFIFWEATSITSFLLVAYKTKDEAARKGAFKALFITGGGGIALLAGLLFVSAIAGGASFATILSSGDALRSSAWYPVMFGLVALGAFTKSAQAPAHIWLPNAMSAPTPASAFLHSATMVKAGIYLMARMFPALGGTDLWFWTLILFGTLTMLAGAIIGMKQTDLKAVLAYSTISQLGVLMLLIGQSDAAAFKALVIGVIAHAFYKGGLFLIAGIVDHSTGTRDLRKLGRIWRALPFSFAIAAIVGASAGGLPPMLGFLSKETLLADIVEHPDPGIWAWLLPAAVVLMGAFMLAEASVLVLDTFVTRPGAGFPKAYLDLPLTGAGKDDPEDVEEIDTHGSPSSPPHLRGGDGGEAPAGMLLGPAVLATLSALFVLLAGFGAPAFLSLAASAAYGAPVKVSLDLYHGINLPLILSVIAIALGVILFVARTPARAVLLRIDERFSMNRLYDATLAGIDKLAFWVTRTQAGRVRHYLMAMIVAILALLLLFGQVAQMIGASLSPAFLAHELESLRTLQNGLRVFSLILVVAASLVSVLIKRDLFAILALGASGLSMALLIALEPSPDVALVQVIVDILSTVVLVLAITRLPRARRERAEQINHSKAASNLPRDVILSASMGAVVAAVCLYALVSRPRESVVTPYYEANSKALTGAADIVGAIVVDFRGFDTMIEITVFSVAGLGVYTLLRHAMKKRETTLLEARARGETPGGAEEAIEVIGSAGAPQHPTQDLLPAFIRGIGSLRTSSFVQLLAQVALPLALVVACVHIIYGHDQPGDGFTAGVIVSLAVGLWYVVFGYEQAKARLSMLKPSLLIGAGIMTVMLGSIAPVFLGGTFFSPYDFGAALGLPLPQGFFFSTSFLFEIAICFCVIGSATFIIDTLGHPERDLE